MSRRLTNRHFYSCLYLLRMFHNNWHIRYRGNFPIRFWGFYIGTFLCGWLFTLFVLIEPLSVFFLEQEQKKTIFLFTTFSAKTIHTSMKNFTIVFFLHPTSYEIIDIHGKFIYRETPRVPFRYKHYPIPYWKGLAKRVKLSHNLKYGLHCVQET